MKRETHSDAHYQALQQKFAAHYEAIFLDDLAEKTIVVIPSLTLDQEILKALKGVQYYEERLLCLLMLLRMPRTRVVFVSSMPIDPSIIDYYLHLLPGITGFHARERLTLLSCYDASKISLTEKVLQRPRLIQRIKAQIKSNELAHMVCFNETEAEKRLALALNIPVYGCDPSLWYLGTKTGSRRIFKELQLNLPAGIEDLHSEHDIAAALVQLKRNNPSLRKAVIKMNDGFSGDGNAIFRYSEDLLNQSHPIDAVQAILASNLSIVANGLDYLNFLQKFNAMGGIVEEFIDGEHKESPSVQLRINPLGASEVISTHDQLLGGESGQVFLGATFPANPEYTYDIAAIGMKIADELQRQGVLGRFGIDFISVKEPTGWKHYAIEINLRKGGTTHPFLMLQFLTDGTFNWRDGVYIMPNGQTRYYFASDNVVDEKYKGLTPQDLIDIAHCNRIQYDGVTQCGVTFHMIGALSQYGKLGLVCIGRSIEEAKAYFGKTLAVLDAESTQRC
ncbi:MAG TPA: ATP-grasp domain-containing protein [Haliscomenobacter sp.]|uniref:peptide ligase PGM1-related protein n=1 Tax=Haliscomenobacter sp. TaxID=2717303 RepID=UPI002BD91D04|nr:ATP-grasp domain-containing protein [Haliscomenobacter sp.]HOY18802.1 ATP-grasp domain-containing protein [Haliscomenobacter sp.]